MFKLCVVIPVYNHEDAIGPTLTTLLPHGYPVILVDDGSHQRCAQVLTELAAMHCDQVELVVLPQNRGKGGAVKAGLRYALQAGFTHALQIDADGQHDLTDLPAFVSVAQAQPEQLISGCPVYDDGVPALRYYSRYLTHVWVWINTLSLQIRDTMCGFRVYPLTAVVAMLDRQTLGERMQFDIEVMVHWYWQGGTVHYLPTQVQYPLDGVSHFDAWRDNLLISKMHARLFFGMLRRLPSLLRRTLSGR